MSGDAPKLSEEIRDAIDGGEECRGRDSQLTEWIKKADALELNIDQLKSLLKQRDSNEWMPP